MCCQIIGHIARAFAKKKINGVLQLKRRKQGSEKLGEFNDYTAEQDALGLKTRKLE